MKKTMLKLVCVVVILMSSLASASIVIDGATTALPWDSSVSVVVGNAAAGSVTVDGGTTVATNYAEIGYKTNGQGTATLSGSGTKWTATRFRVGYYTAAVSNNWGMMTISGGAVAESTTYTFLGVTVASTAGYVDVDGAGSQLINGSSLRVGDFGKGILTVTNGGLVQAVGNDSGIGYSNSSGTAGSEIVVKDSGSKLVLSGNFYVSRYGYQNTLTIDDSGLVKIGGVLYMNAGGSLDRGAINIRDGGQLALKGSASDLNSFLALITTAGTKRINYWNGTAWDIITNATPGTDFTVADGTGDLAGYAVLTVPEPATIGLLTMGTLGLALRRRRA